MQTILKVENLHKGFGGIKAVDGCCFTVEENSITALIGPNGAGKTTMFSIITGFLQPDKGKILLYSKDITKTPPYLRAMDGISQTFQLLRVFPKITAIENMLLALEQKQASIFSALCKRFSLKKEEKELESRAMEILETIGLHVKSDEFAGNLSYGQQKLLSIAVAYARKPKLLILDEPAAGVNPSMLRKIEELIKKLRASGTTILFIEHDMEFVMRCAERIIVLDYGKEIAIGTPKQIQKNTKVIDAYLGRVKK